MWQMKIKVFYLSIALGMLVLGAVSSYRDSLPTASAGEQASPVVQEFATHSLASNRSAACEAVAPAVID